jgi:hypothetical protein
MTQSDPVVQTFCLKAQKHMKPAMNSFYGIQGETVISIIREMQLQYKLTWIRTPKLVLVVCSDQFLKRLDAVDTKSINW